VIHLLTAADIPAAMRLKEAAGWNQTEQDWVNLLAAEPEGCFGINCDGALVASAAGVCFPRAQPLPDGRGSVSSALAWIGMVLTAPEYRGRGFARRLMDHTLEFLTRRGVEWVKLDATDMGRPLYARLGFEDEALVERWCLPKVESRPPVDLPAWRLEDFAQLDAAAFGADRTNILRPLAVESAAVPGEGYAMGRPGTKATYFGPCVARSAEAARRLLEWFLARHPGESIFWDLLPGQPEALRLAQEFGFEPRRRLVRMALRGSPGAALFRHDDSAVYAIAGFEYG